MRRSLVISGTAHAVLLVWGLIAFVARPSEAPLADPLPVEFVSATEFSQLTAGVKNAPEPIDNATPVVDKVGEPKPVEELAPKVVDKPEIKIDSALTPEPEPEAKSQPKIAEKSQPKPEPKAEPKPAEKADKAEDKPRPDQIGEELKKGGAKKQRPSPKIDADQVAEELKKGEAKKQRPSPKIDADQVAEELKKAEAKKQRPSPKIDADQVAEELKKAEAKKQRPSPKIDADQVAALLDHREPQRQVATAESLNSIASLGAPVGQAAHLSQSELYALRAKLISLWNPPEAVSAHPDKYVVSIRIRLARNHRLVGQPVVLTSGHRPLFEATRDSAVRALFQAQPYSMLSLTTYDQWKEIDIDFDPREVFGG
jgi:colicin import membrane protein